MTRRAPAFVVLTALLLAASAVVTVLMLTTLGFFDPSNAGGLIGYTAVLWLLYAAALWMLRRVPARAAVALILAGSAALGVSALAGPPNTSTDSARYAWDGIVQNGQVTTTTPTTGQAATHPGVSPYLYVPADDALAAFRTSWLFPPVYLDADGRPQCDPTPRIERTITLPTFTVICTTINRPQVHTIYPPVAELYFAGVRFFVDPSVEYGPFQIGGLLISVGSTVALLLALRRRRLDLRWAALWAWSPFVLSEAITNSHVDSLAALLVLVASLLVSRARRGSPRGLLGGIALGLAIATKLVPVIAAPALLKRQPIRVISASIVTFAALYIPYIATTGIAVIGYLPGYLSEEGYDDGSRFALVSLVAPGTGAIILSALILIATAVLVWRRTNPSSPWLGQVVMIGTTMLVVTPHYSWYALLLVPFIVMSGRWEWMIVPLALTAQLLVPTLAVARLSFGVALLVILSALYLRRRARMLEAARIDVEPVS